MFPLMPPTERKGKREPANWDTCVRDAEPCVVSHAGCVLPGTDTCAGSVEADHGEATASWVRMPAASGGRVVGYDGFISYSHAADGRLAPALQRGLQRLAKKWNSRRALHVFRDETGLSTNPHLWSAIETALDDSDWFVLLASPESASSEWVNKEVAHWVATKPVDHILPVVTDGVWEWDAIDQRLHRRFHVGAARVARRVAGGGPPSRFALGARRDGSGSAQQPLPGRDRRSRGTDARHRERRPRGRGHPPAETRAAPRPRWHHASSCSCS